MSYEAAIGEDTTYELAPCSTKALEELESLRMRSTTVDDRTRRQLAIQWGEDPGDVFEEEEEILPPDYYKQAFEIVADSPGDTDDVDAQVVEEMVTDFLPSGAAGQSGRPNGLNGLKNIIGHLLDQNPNQTE